MAGMAQAVSVNDHTASDAGGMANYWDSSNQMQSVVSLYWQSNGSGCTGTLINSRTVLTAAHCVVNNDNVINNTDLPTQIRFSPDASISNINDRAISGIVAHPLFKTENNNTAGGDLALISLATPVTTVPVIRLIRPSDPQPIVGSLVTIAGYGYASNGSGNDIVTDNKRRIAQTNIGSTHKAEASDVFAVYQAQFRDPNSPASPDKFGLSTLGVPVPSKQGSNGAGDSGGPLFLVMPDGSLMQIGTVMGTPDERDGGYGITTVWTSTVWYTNWLDANNPLRNTSVASGNHVWSDALAWTDTQGRHSIPNNADGSFSGRGQSGRYYQVKLNSPGTLTVDIDPTTDSLTVAGTGTVLSVPNSRTLNVLTDTQLQNGKITLTGVLNTTSFSMSGGQLTGTGRLTASNGATVTSGVIAPGTSTAIGTLSIAGNYMQSAGTTFVVRADGATSDRLAVTGTATLLGGTLLAMSGGSFRPDTNYNFLTTSNGLSGNFSRVGTDMIFLDPMVKTSATDASLSVTRNATPFSTAASANSTGVARAIDTLGWNSALYANIANSNTIQATHKLTLLSGESFASTTSVLMDQTHNLRNTLVMRTRRGVDPKTALVSTTALTDEVGDHWRNPLMMRTQYIPDGDRAETLADKSRTSRGSDESTAVVSPAAWAQVSGSWGKLASNNGMASANTSSRGIMAGIERQFDNRWFGGVAASFNHSDIGINDRQASGKTDSYGIALYGGTSTGQWQFRAGTSYTQHHIDSRRALAFHGYADTLTTSYHAHTTQVFGEIGYATNVDSINLEPFFNLAFASTSLGAFQENGGEAALAGRANTQNQTFSTTGLRAASHVDLSSGSKLTLTGALGWQHAIGNTTPSSQLTLLAGGSSFSVSGTPIARDSLNLETGIIMAIGKSSQLSLTYSSLWAKYAQDQTLQAQWRMQF